MGCLIKIPCFIIRNIHDMLECFHKPTSTLCVQDPQGMKLFTDELLMMKGK